MLKLSSTTVVGLVCCVMACGRPTDDVAYRLGLMPTPRQIALNGDRIDLSGWQIVTPPTLPLCRVGAAEINLRIEELGGKPLQIVDSPQSRRGRIVVGLCSGAAVRVTAKALGVVLTRSDPGEQGYVIRCGEIAGAPVILAGGSDEQGALYACITLRRMIQPVQGNVRLLSGSVRDWPDYKIRCNGSLNLQLIRGMRRPETRVRAVAALKRDIDFCLRHKINYVHTRGHWTRPTPDDRARAIRRQMVEVSRYARSRGIRTRVIGKTEIGRYLTPEQRKGAVVRKAGTSYAWSALDAHRKHARDWAEYLRDAQVGVFALHPVDSGGYLDPETWSKRGPQCKATYGDDRARASLEQFKLYFDIIREQCPDIELEAVSYPYHYQFAMPEFITQAQGMGADMPNMGWVRGIEDSVTASRVQKQLSDYHRHLSAGLSEDVTVTFREARRDVFLACGKLYEGHPVTIWIYPDRNKGWRGTFCPQVRMTRSFWRPHMRDHYFVASSWTRGNDARVQRLAQQEYLWCVDQPDASSEFTANSRWYETEGCDITAFQREVLIPRICRILYGAAAPPFRDLVTANVSLNYVLEPGAIASERGENMATSLTYMRKQADAFARLHQNFAELAPRLDNTPDLPAETVAWSLYWLKFTGLSAIKAELELGLGQCRELLAAGKSEEALTQVAKLRTRLDGLQQQCDAVHGLVDRDPRHTKESSYSRSVDNLLHRFRPAGYGAVLEQLEQKATTAATMGVIPDHIAEQLSRRRIEVCRFKPTFELKVDGKRGEGGWMSSQTVDFFTADSKTLAQFESRVWILWDDQSLYLYLEAFDPFALRHKPSVPATKHDGSVFRDDCFELFLDTNADLKSYYHLAVSSAGAKYDAVKVGEGRPDVAWGGDWSVATVRGRNSWIAEFHIPFATLGGAPKAGDVWRVNMARHRAARPGSQETEDSNIITAARNHPPELFVPMTFSQRTRITEPAKLRATLKNVKRYDQTTTYGYSTFLVFSPTVESDRSLVDQRVVFEVSDTTGKVVAKKELAASRIPGRWSAVKPVMMDLGQAYKGDLTLAASCGGKTRTREIQSFLIGPKGKVRDAK
ncbi:MAG: hypothetical protein HON70_31445 [Lentisphaerae bacterium]|nr:hypothetical protein [Lentisphaerota bacterium]